MILPACSAHALPGLPYDDPGKACQVVLDNLPEMPNLPALAKYFKTPGAYVEGMPCLKFDEKREAWYFDLSDSKTVERELLQHYERYLAEDIDHYAYRTKYTVGWDMMLDLLRQRQSPEVKAVSIVLRGPFSLGIYLTDQDMKPIFYNETMRDALVKYLALKAKWCHKKVHEYLPGMPVAIWVTEAQMQFFGSAYIAVTEEQVINSINEVVEGIRSFDGIAMVHCCGDTDWSVLMNTSVDIVNFDAYGHFDKFALYTEELKAFLGRGGMVSWGIIPNTNDKIVVETAETLVEKLEAMLQVLTGKGISRELLLESMLISPSCGFSGASPRNAEIALQLLNEVAEVMSGKQF